MFFRKIQNQKPFGSRNLLLKALWIQELTPENPSDPGADSWIHMVFRSQLLEPHGFQESAPGSRALSGVSSWIHMVFRSQLLDPHGFQESAPGSTGFSGVSSWIQSAFRSQFLDPNGFWFWFFPKNIIKKDDFFFNILMNNVLFFSCFSLLFGVFFGMFFRFYYDFVFVFFHFLMLFFCFLGVFDSIIVNLIQVEATCIRKKHQTIPQMKVQYGLFLTTNDVENWKS